MRQLERVKALINRVTLNFMGTSLEFRVEHDVVANNPSKFNPMHEPRVFIQLSYITPDAATGKIGSWKGRKWYLSEYMTDDEIIKTGYLAFRTCIEHEVLESFRVDGVSPFNPHLNFEKLLEVSHEEVKRTEMNKVYNSMVTDPDKSNSDHHGYFEIQNGQVVGVGDANGWAWLGKNNPFGARSAAESILKEWPNLYEKALQYVENQTK